MKSCSIYIPILIVVLLFSCTTNRSLKYGINEKDKDFKYSYMNDQDHNSEIDRWYTEAGDKEFSSKRRKKYNQNLNHKDYKLSSKNPSNFFTLLDSLEKNKEEIVMNLTKNSDVNKVANNRIDAKNAFNSSYEYKPHYNKSEAGGIKGYFTLKNLIWLLISIVISLLVTIIVILILMAVGLFPAI